MTLRETRIRTENNEKIQQQLEKLREYERKEEQEKFRLSQLRQSKLVNVVYVQETLKNVIFNFENYLFVFTLCKLHIIGGFKFLGIATKYRWLGGKNITVPSCDFFFLPNLDLVAVSTFCENQFRHSSYS